MSLRDVVQVLVAASVLLACGGPRVARHGTPRHYAQTDSLSTTCMRSPNCAAVMEEEGILPWLSRAASAVETTTTVVRLLNAADLTRVEALLVECAGEANSRVNDSQFGAGKYPTQDQCKELVKDSRGKDVSRAQELGRMKHEIR